MKGRAWSVLAALAVVLAMALVVLGLGNVQTASGKPPAAASSGCGLANGIKHVIQIQFDNTVLISHAETGILSTLTGVYPDRFGVPVSNSFRYFKPDGTTRTGVAFAYWTAPLFDPAGPPFPPAAQTDLTPELFHEQGKVSPAPWVPWTRAGCDVGQIATANTILENTGIDIPTFFGPTSPEALQANADSPGASATQTFADYV